MSIWIHLKERVTVHAVELTLALLATALPIYLFVAEAWIAEQLQELPYTWLVRVIAILLAATLFLAAWIVFRRRKLIFLEDKGVYQERKSGFHVCPRCLADNKVSLLKDEQHAFRCLVCRQFYDDPTRPTPQRPKRQKSSYWDGYP